MAKRVVLGLARVDHDRQAASPGESDLLAEHLLLRLARREVVVVVEADLAKRPRQRLSVDRRVGHRRRGGGVIRERPGRVRVDADGEPDIRPAC